jgi:multidrug efflux pump subunit AcrA (membrane-fusion protein)
MSPRQTAEPATPEAVSGKPDWAKSDRQLGRDMRMAAGEPVTRARWSWIILAVIVVAAGGYAFYATQIAPPPAPVDAATPARQTMQVNPDEMTVLKPRRLERLVRVTGTLAPWQGTDLSSQTGGQIEQVMVRPGDGVTAGDMLVQVDIESLTVAAVELRLRNAAMTAPFARIVTSRSVEPGQYVGIGAPLVSLVDLSQMEMLANAPVADGALLARDQTVMI